MVAPRTKITCPPSRLPSRELGFQPSQTLTWLSSRSKFGSSESQSSSEAPADDSIVSRSSFSSSDRLSLSRLSISRSLILSNHFSWKSIGGQPYMDDRSSHVISHGNTRSYRTHLSSSDQ